MAVSGVRPNPNTSLCTVSETFSFSAITSFSASGVGRGSCSSCSARRAASS